MLLVKIHLYEHSTVSTTTVYNPIESHSPTLPPYLTLEVQQVYLA